MLEQVILTGAFLGWLLWLGAEDRPTPKDRRTPDERRAAYWAAWWAALSEKYPDARAVMESEHFQRWVGDGSSFGPHPATRRALLAAAKAGSLLYAMQLLKTYKAAS